MCQTVIPHDPAVFSVSDRTKTNRVISARTWGFLIPSPVKTFFCTRLAFSTYRGLWCYSLAGWTTEQPWPQWLSSGKKVFPNIPVYTIHVFFRQASWPSYFWRKSVSNMPFSMTAASGSQWPSPFFGLLGSYPNRWCPQNHLDAWIELPESTNVTEWVGV